METKMITGSDNQTISLNGLISDMDYLAQVAGVNREGVGVYRNITVTTPQSESHTYKHIWTLHNSYVVGGHITHSH